MQALHVFQRFIFAQIQSCTHMFAEKFHMFFSGQDWEPSKRKKTRAKKSKKGAKIARKPRAKAARRPARAPPPRVTPSQGILNLHGRSLTMPLRWWVEPMRTAMRKAVRPPTATTRRRQKVIQMQVPMEAFVELLKDFVTAELDGLLWIGGPGPTLQPTRETAAFLEYQYYARKPSQLNKLWDLATWDNVIPGTLWKRGAGAQLLHLSQAACRRGQTSLLISSVAGNVCVRLRAPKDQRSMPTFRLVFTVLTLDQQNHILWNQDFAPGTAAALRNLVESGRRVMVTDPLYPTAVTTVAQLPHTAPTNTVWDPTGSAPALLLTGGTQG